MTILWNAEAAQLERGNVTLRPTPSEALLLGYIARRPFYLHRYADIERNVHIGGVRGVSDHLIRLRKKARRVFGPDTELITTFKSQGLIFLGGWKRSIEFVTGKTITVRNKPMTREDAERLITDHWGMTARGEGISVGFPARLYVAPDGRFSVVAYDPDGTAAHFVIGGDGWQEVGAG